MFCPQITNKPGYHNWLVRSQMVQALCRSNNKKLVVSDKGTAAEGQKNNHKKILTGVRESQLIFPQTEFWAREIGPVFVTNIKGKEVMADSTKSIKSY